ncbi:hypothetical protein ACJX0J_034949 [Zea mays]
MPVVAPILVLFATFLAFILLTSSSIPPIYKNLLNLTYIKGARERFFYYFYAIIIATPSRLLRPSELFNNIFTAIIGLGNIMYTRLGRTRRAVWEVLYQSTIGFMRQMHKCYTITGDGWGKDYSVLFYFDLLVMFHYAMGSTHKYSIYPDIAAFSLCIIPASKEFHLNLAAALRLNFGLPCIFVIYSILGLLASCMILAGIISSVRINSYFLPTQYAQSRFVACHFLTGFSWQGISWQAAGGKNKVIYEDVSMERGAFL